MQENIRVFQFQFIDAINLMLDNAFTYNRKNTRIYKHAARLKDVFKANIDAPMKRLGYCCGKNVSYLMCM
jgi:E1A/CREB-binding protein